MVYPYNVILLTHKRKEVPTDSCYNRDETWKHDAKEWKKEGTSNRYWEVLLRVMKICFLWISNFVNYTENHWSVQSKRMNIMLCELYFNKAFILKIQNLGWRILMLVVIYLFQVGWACSLGFHALILWFSKFGSLDQHQHFWGTCYKGLAQTRTYWIRTLYFWKAHPVILMHSEVWGPAWPRHYFKNTEKPGFAAWFPQLLWCDRC